MRIGARQKCIKDFYFIFFNVVWMMKRQCSEVSCY